MRHKGIHYQDSHESTGLASPRSIPSNDTVSRDDMMSRLENTAEYRKRRCKRGLCIIVSECERGWGGGDDSSWGMGGVQAK